MHFLCDYAVFLVRNRKLVLESDFVPITFLSETVHFEKGQNFASSMRSAFVRKKKNRPAQAVSYLFRNISVLIY